MSLKNILRTCKRYYESKKYKIILNRLDSGSLLSISYEDLVRYPAVCLSTVIRWLGYEPNQNIVEDSITRTSELKTSVIGAGEAWQRNGTEAVNPKMISGFTEKCLEHGSIGVWKEYFSESDINKVENKLATYGLGLEEFVLNT